MKNVVVVLFFSSIGLFSYGQDKFGTRNGKIALFSSTSLKNIEASNHSVFVLLDTKSGILQFAVLMKAFEFEKALMKEHFNKILSPSIKFLLFCLFE